MTIKKKYRDITLNVYSTGTKAWYFKGQLHRTDGPAIEWANGMKEWWIEGISYSEKEFNKKIKELNGHKLFSLARWLQRAITRYL